MAQDNQESRKASPEETITSQERPLQSWKEIAAYLDRDERTAQRWEKAEGLPVRRHRGGLRSSVYAYASELDAWRAARRPKQGEEIRYKGMKLVITKMRGMKIEEVVLIKERIKDRAEGRNAASAH